MDIRDYSTTAASNTADFPESMAPSAVNDSARKVQADIAKLITDIRGTIATTGSSNAYAIALATTPASLGDGLFFSFTANHTNTAAATLAVTPSGGSAFTTKAIRKNGISADVALDAGDIVSGCRYDVQYEASANSAAGAFILMNPAATGEVLVSTGDLTATAFAPIALPASFKSFRLVVRHFRPVSSAYMAAQVSTDGGSTYQTTTGSYAWLMQYLHQVSGASTLVSNSSNDHFIALSPVALDTTSTSPAHVDMFVEPGSASIGYSLSWRGAIVNTAGMSITNGVAFAVPGVRMTHIRLSATSGNMAAVKYELYGLR